MKSSSIQHTLPSSSNVPSNATVQSFGVNPSDPDMVVCPYLYTASGKAELGQVKTRIRRAACRRSLDRKFTDFDRVFLHLPVFKRHELREELRKFGKNPTAKSQIIKDELTRYCNESKLSITVCHTLSDYIRVLRKHPDLVIMRGVRRKDFTNHLPEAPTVPSSSVAEHYTAPEISDSPAMRHLYRYDLHGRPGDGESEDEYTASDPGCYGDDDNREDDDDDEDDDAEEEGKSTRSREAHTSRGGRGSD